LPSASVQFLGVAIARRRVKRCRQRVVAKHLQVSYGSFVESEGDSLTSKSNAWRECAIRIQVKRNRPSASGSTIAIQIQTRIVQSSADPQVELSDENPEVDNVKVWRHAIVGIRDIQQALSYRPIRLADIHV